MMNEMKSPDSLLPSPESARPSFQPFVVALVCLIFICLFLIMGFMNLGTMDKGLDRLTENNGLSVIKNVQQLAENYFHQMIQSPRVGFDPETGNPFGEDAFALPESFLIELTDLARKLDSEWETGRPDNEMLSVLLSEENLWLIALLDEKGNVTFKSRAIPDGILAFIGPVVRGEAEFKMNIFDRTGNLEGIGVITLRQKSGKGTVLLALDESGFRKRSLRFSLQRAVEEIGLGADTAYFIMIDQDNRVIGLAGNLLEDRLEALHQKSPANDTDRTTIRKITVHNQPLLEIDVPVTIKGGHGRILRLGLKTDMAEQILKKNRNSMILSSVFMAAIAFLSMWFLYRTQNRYLSRMQALERQIQQAERLSALGRLASGVAHEIRNPLNAISMAVQRIQRDNPSKLIQLIRDEIDRLNQIIEEFISVSRSRRLELKRYNLIELLDQIVMLMEEEVESRGIKFQTEWPDSPLMVSMDSEKMKQALLNILKNAMESIAGEGVITLTAKRAGKDRISVETSDTGIGMETEAIKHIFDLGYSTKDQGLGIGLPLVYEIIRGHGGEVHVTSNPGVGTRFKIHLPVSNP